MLYDPEAGWYFIHVPKNAGTSIVSQFTLHKTPSLQGEARIKRKIALHENRRKHGIKVLPYSIPTYHNKATFWSWTEETNGLHPIAILRNPWSRALSLYLFNLRITQKNLDEEWARFDHPRLIREGFKKSWMPDGFFVDRHGRSVEYSEETGRAWAQNDDQFSWLEGVQGARWFRLEDQLDEFHSFTGLPRGERVNTTKKTNFREYYDDELVDRIGTLFERDVKLGGYSFE